MKLIQVSLAFGLLALLAACGISPQEACKQSVVVTCQKLVECTPEAAKKLLPALKDQASCEANFNTQSGCNKENPCGDGKTYDAVAASACINEWKAVTCTDVENGKSDDKTPSCSKVCVDAS
jgi:hypothetical protein